MHAYGLQLHLLAGLTATKDQDNIPTEHPRSPSDDAPRGHSIIACIGSLKTDFDTLRWWYNVEVDGVSLNVRTTTRKYCLT
jgi:hypothetical protein